MTNLLKHSMLALALATTATTAAYAHDGDHDNRKPQPPFTPAPRHPAQAPEIDMNLALAGFTMLAGSLTVLRSKRSR